MVTVTSGRGEVAFCGPMLDVARLVIEADRQLTLLLAGWRQQESETR